MLKHIYRVDLDLTGLCNRRCVFCPRADDSYPNENKHMSFEVIEEVIKQLRKIGFQSWIELAGRGEPTLHPQFLKIVDMLSKDAWKLRLTTNGYKMHKWWNPKTLKKFDEVILNTYTNEQEYEQRVRDYAFLPNGMPVEQYYKPDGLSVQEINDISPFQMPNDTDTKPVKWTFAFNNRAGHFNKNRVNSPCWHPMRQIFIDYNGYYQMCCNDWTHQIKIGHVLKRGLIDMYLNDPKINRIRWSLLNNERERIKPCSMCDDNQGGKPNTLRLIEEFKNTDTYRYHVTKIAGSTGLMYRESLERGDNI